MKILHVIPSVSRVHGGPSVAIETMTRSLAAAGHDVHVATTDDDGAGHLDVPLAKPVVCDNVAYWFFPRQTQFYKFSFPLTRWLAQTIRDYDVVHIHALFSYASMPAALYAHRHKIPYIVRPLGTLNRVGMQQYHPVLKRISFPLVESKIIHHAACLHFTGELERAQAQAIGVASPGVVIPIGVPLDDSPIGTRGAWLKQNAPHFEGRTVFLFLGRLDPIKGFDVLLPAFVQLHKSIPRVALVIAGAGSALYDRELHDEVARLGLTEAVLFTGHVEGAAKRALLRDADVFVLPSRSENQGVAAVEAMAAGLPVIITPEVGISSTIVSHGAGLVVPADPPLFADAMQRLAQQTQERLEYGVRAKQLARETFSVAAMRDALLNLYQSVGAGKL